MSISSYDKIADWLAEVADDVRDLEKKAGIALYDHDDESAYRELMRAKALRLAALAEEALPYFKDKDIDEYNKKNILDRLEKFSKSALTALDIDSPFFMSALLYPDEYKDGENNDLENFVLSVRKLA